MSPARRTVLWVLGILLVGAALRLAVWWVSPPINAFDDHLEPIALYATQWTRPAPDACWQCYQPPLYYAVSVLFARPLSGAVSGDSFLRLLALIPMQSGLVTVLLCHRVSRAVFPARGGVFFPGDAFPDRSTRTFFLVGLTWSF